MSGRGLSPESVPLKIDERALDGQLVVRLTGELDMAGAPDIEALLDARAAEGKHVLVDIDGLDFIDSAGLRSIMVGYAAFARDAGSMAVSPGSHRVRRVIEIAGVSGEPPFVDALPADRLFAPR